METIHIGGDEICFWDIGGCDKIRPLVRHYMYPGFCILFLVDTPLCITDQEALDYTLEELEYQCREALENQVRFVGIALMKQDLLQGMNGVSYVEGKVKECMEGVFPGGFGSRYDIYTNEGHGGISVVTGKGVEDGWLLKELHGGMKGVSRGKPDLGNDPKGAILDSAGSRLKVPMTSPPSRQDAMKPVLNRDQLRALIGKQNAEDPEADLTPAAFFEKMESGTLEKWDHRAHLKAGFYVLLEHLWAGHGLWDAVEDFLEKLERMLSNDARKAEAERREKRFRNTVHRYVYSPKPWFEVVI